MNPQDELGQNNGQKPRVIGDILPPNQNIAPQTQFQPQPAQTMPQPQEQPVASPQAPVQTMQQPQTQPAQPQVSPSVIQPSQMFQPDNFVMNPDQDGSSQHKVKKSKKWLIIVLLTILLMGGAAAAYFLVFNKKEAEPAKTSTVSLVQTDEDLGVTFTKLASDNKVLNLKDTAFKSVKGVFVYKTTSTTKDLSKEISTSTCDLTSNDMRTYESGIMVMKNVLSSSLGSVTIDSLVNLYANAGADAEKVGIEGKDLVRIADGGNGINASCTQNSDKFVKTMDVTSSYIYIAEDGTDYFIAIASAKNTINDIEVDQTLAEQASKNFSDSQLLDFVSNFIASN